MKTNAIVRIILFSVAILVLLGILTTALLFDTFMFNTSSDGNNLPVAFDGITSQGAVNAEDVDNLEIEWAAGSITIVPDENTDQIHIAETGTNNEKDAMVYSLTGNTLNIQFCKESIRFPSLGMNVSITKDLVITVPADWMCNSLDIEAASAEVNVHDLTFNELDFTGASGDCVFTNCTVGELDMETVSGNVSFHGCVTDFNCEAVSADCTLELLGQARSITMESVSGDLELLLPVDCGFSCETETVSGSFKSDFNCTSHGDVHVYGDGACQIKLSGVSGDIHILQSSVPKNCDH